MRERFRPKSVNSALAMFVYKINCQHMSTCHPSNMVRRITRPRNRWVVQPWGVSTSIRGRDQVTTLVDVVWIWMMGLRQIHTDWSWLRTNGKDGCCVVTDRFSCLEFVWYESWLKFRHISSIWWNCGAPKLESSFCYATLKGQSQNIQKKLRWCIAAWGGAASMVAPL